MKLSGRWIETAGFEPGQRVRITVEYQRSSLSRFKCMGPRMRLLCSPNLRLMVRHSTHQLPSIQILQSS
ncbi:SymE family type I addiction module toxin [Paraburkholderia phytofirmans]|uniref:SymE family type I addiction module toxin n=2 Tax=Paraburkholderia phytofirmans TaxID=261302 RepID=A0ABW9B9I2_9BURK